MRSAARLESTRVSSSRASIGRLRTLVAPVVAAHGCDLEDLELAPAGRRTVVRVIIDHDDGVSLDRVADVSHAVSDALDQADAVGGAYTLEVSSPGVDRPLTARRHWRRARGRLVHVRVDSRPCAGRIVEVDDAGVVLSTDGTQARYGWAQLSTGKVAVEFGRGGQEESR